MASLKQVKVAIFPSSVFIVNVQTNLVLCIVVSKVL